MDIKLFNGDCIEKSSEILNNSIDTIITSPPYNKKGLHGGSTKIGNNLWKKFNIDYSTYDDNLDEEQYRKWQIDFLNIMYEKLKPNGSMFYNHKIRRSDNKSYFPDWIFATKFNLYQMIIWNRMNCCDMRNDYLYPTTELIFWLCKDKPRVYKQELLPEYQKEIWNITPTKDDFHPASFPNQLVSNCIYLTTKENDTVFDPFMGSGTTGVECIRSNRNFIGIELDEKYFNYAKDKIYSEKIENKLF